MKHKLTYATFLVASSLFVTACDEEQFEDDAIAICQIWDTHNSNPALPYFDIEASQYRDAGQEADLDGNGFINILELNAFCQGLVNEYGWPEMIDGELQIVRDEPEPDGIG